jgi:ribonuclease M5
LIKEVIVVEGKSDIARVKQAVDADVIATGGLGLSERAIADIRAAYNRRGIIILTDPDGPGERIRKRLTRLFPHALHAFVPKKEASTSHDVGIEDASPEAIRKALESVKTIEYEPEEQFTMKDLIDAGMTGTDGARERREEAGAILGIGYGNSGLFLKKLNHFGVTRSEWDMALRQLEEKNA